MTFRSWIFGSMVLLVLGGCGRPGRYDALAHGDSTGQARLMATADPRPEEPGAVRVGSAPGRMLVKTVQLELLVGDPERAGSGTSTPRT